MNHSISSFSSKGSKKTKTETKTKTKNEEIYIKNVKKCSFLHFTPTSGRHRNKFGGRAQRVAGEGVPEYRLRGSGHDLGKHSSQS